MKYLPIILLLILVVGCKPKVSNLTMDTAAPTQNPLIKGVSLLIDGPDSEELIAAKPDLLLYFHKSETAEPSMKQVLLTDEQYRKLQTILEASHFESWTESESTPAEDTGMTRYTITIIDANAAEHQTRCTIGCPADILNIVNAMSTLREGQPASA